MTTYTHNGFEKPSVTTVIGDSNDKSKWMVPWATKCMKENLLKRWGDWAVYDADGNEWLEEDEWLESARWDYKEVSNKALEDGSEVHDRIERYLKFGISPKQKSNAEVENAWNAFLKFEDENHIQIIESTEKQVYGQWDAGTLDFEGIVCVGNNEPEKWILDWKTAKSHKLYEHGPQIARYASMTDFQWDRIGVVLLSKETREYSYSLKDYTADYKKFLKLYELWLEAYMIKHSKIAKAAGYERDQSIQNNF